jgi:hypothetical protein
MAISLVRLSLLLPTVAAQGGVYADTYNMLLSDTLPGNLLPQVQLYGMTHAK